MADDGVKIGSAYIDVGAKDSKLKSDFEQAKNTAKKQVEEMNAQLSKIKMSVDNRLLKMKYDEAVRWRNDLQAKYEKQIKMNMDLATIQRTKAALDSVNNSLGDVKRGSEEAAKSFNLLGSIKGIAATLGVAFGITQLISFTKQAISSAAELEVLRSNFKGTEEDLELFRIATAGTVTDANLIKLSNQATDLGISLQQQALFFALAEGAADKYGGSVEEGMSRVIMASEGNVKALKSLGIQKKVFEEIVKELTQEFARQGNEIDAEALKQIQIQAVLKATGMTLEDLINKIQDSKDKLESWGTAWDKIQRTIGSIVLPVFFDFARVLENAYGWAARLVTALGNIPKDVLSKFGIDISDEALGVTSHKPAAVDNTRGGMFKESNESNGFGSQKVKESWTAVGKTVEEVQSHIATLQSVQKTLVPGSEAWLKNWREIEALTKKIENPFKKEEKDSTNNPFESFEKQKKELAEVNKLLKDKNLTDAQRNILLEKQLQLSAQIFKYEHPDIAVNKLSRTSKLNLGAGLKSGGVFSSGSDKEKSDTDYKNPAIEQLKQWEDEANKADQATERLASTLASAFSQGLSATNSLVGSLGNMIAKFGEVILQAAVFKGLMAGLNLIPGVGSALSWLGLGGHEGGTFMNNARIPAFANGVDSYRVPNGYPNDSFPVMVQSGEDLRVRTPAQRNMAEMNNQALISEVTAMKKSIQALNINMSTRSNQPLIIKSSVPGIEFTEEVVRTNESRMTRGGITRGTGNN